MEEVKISNLIKDKPVMSSQMLQLQKRLAGGKSVIGIDFGFTSINIAQTSIYQGKSTLIKVAVEDILVASEDEREHSISIALKRALSDFDTRNADIICTISNQKAIIEDINLPLMPSEELSDAIKLEISNSSHHQIENPVIDFKVLGKINDKGVEKTSTRVFAIARSSIDGILSKLRSDKKKSLAGFKKVLQIEDLSGLNLIKVIPVAVALENIISKSKKMAQETIATIEIGSMLTEFNIYREANIDYSRKVNVTGLDLTRSLTGAFFSSSGKIELTLMEAEWIKRHFGIPSGGEEFLIKDKITSTQALSLLRPKLEQLVKEISRSFDYYREKNRNAKIDRLLLLGGGSMLRGLPEFLNAELGLPVEIGNPLQDVNVLYEGLLTQKEEINRLILAIGASLGSVQGINLLPEEFRGCKKKFIQTGSLALLAAVILIVSILGFLALFIQVSLVKINSLKVKGEYRTIAAQLKDLKDQLTLEGLSNRRLDMGALLKQLSHAPDKVFITGLNMTGGNFSLTGVVLFNEKEGREQLFPLIDNLKKSSLKAVRVINMKEKQGTTLITSFTIGGRQEPLVQ